MTAERHHTRETLRFSCFRMRNKLWPSGSVLSEVSKTSDLMSFCCWCALNVTLCELWFYDFPVSIHEKFTFWQLTFNSAKRFCDWLSSSSSDVFGCFAFLAWSLELIRRHVFLSRTFFSFRNLQQCFKICKFVAFPTHPQIRKHFHSWIAS